MLTLGKPLANFIKIPVFTQLTTRPGQPQSSHNEHEQFLLVPTSGWTQFTLSITDTCIQIGRHWQIDLENLTFKILFPLIGKCEMMLE